MQYELCRKIAQHSSYSVTPAILEQSVLINIYSADYELLFNHVIKELSIQNMTWYTLTGF